MSDDIQMVGATITVEPLTYQHNGERWRLGIDDSIYEVSHDTSMLLDAFFAERQQRKQEERGPEGCLEETKEPSKMFGESGSELRLHAIERLGMILGGINSGDYFWLGGKKVNTGVSDIDLLWLWRVAHYYLRDEKHNIWFRNNDGCHAREANQAGITVSDEEWEFFNKEDAKIPPQIKPKPVEPEQEPSVKGPKPVPPKNRVFKNERLVKDPDKPKKGFWHRLGIGR